MKAKNKHKQKLKRNELENVANAWVRICLFHIYQKYQNKNTDYEYSK